MKKTTTILLIIVFITLNSCNKDDQPVIDNRPKEIAIEWSKTYGGSKNDFASKIIITSDGGNLTMGQTRSSDGDVSSNYGGSDWWVIKTDNTGTIQWEKNYGGSNADFSEEVIQTNDGGYLLSGRTYSNDGDVSVNFGDLDFFIIKINSIGTIMWKKNYGGSSYDSLLGIESTIDGGYILAGGSQSSDGDITINKGRSDFWIIKIDAIGNLVWEKSYGGSNFDAAFGGIKKTSSGDFIIAGESNSIDGDVTGNNNTLNGWVIKIDANGTLLWEKSFGGNNTSIVFDIDININDDVVLIGITDNGVNNNDLWVFKIDSNGNLIWEKTFGGSDYEEGNSITYTSDGGVLVCGYTNSTDGDISNNLGNDDAWVIKLDANGIKEWDKTFGGSNFDYSYSIKEIAPEQYILAGLTDSTNGDVSTNNGDLDLWLLKLKMVFVDN